MVELPSSPMFGLPSSLVEMLIASVAHLDYLDDVFNLVYSNFIWACSPAFSAPQADPLGLLTPIRSLSLAYSRWSLERVGVFGLPLSEFPWRAETRPGASPSRQPENDSISQI